MASITSLPLMESIVESDPPSLIIEPIVRKRRVSSPDQPSEKRFRDSSSVIEMINETKLMVRFLSNKIFFLVFIYNLAHLSDDNGQILWRDAIYDFYADGSLRRRQFKEHIQTCTHYDDSLKETFSDQPGDSELRKHFFSHFKILTKNIYSTKSRKLSEGIFITISEPELNR